MFPPVFTLRTQNAFHLASVNTLACPSIPPGSRLSPGLRELGERRQAAGVHVPAYVDVDGGVGLGELGGQRDTLGRHGRHR